MDTFLFFLIVGLLSCVHASIKIKEMKVPQAISLNGSIDYADLDCNFEAKNESGIEVKWFFNGQIELIYQWVPGYNITGTGSELLKNRLDPEYKVTNDSDTKYRGFRILNLGRDLTGNYTCKISGDVSEAVGTRQMIIYSPAESELELNLLINDGLVNCSTSGIYPMPKVDFYIISENGTRIDVSEDVQSGVDDNGFYNITASHDFTEYNHTLTGPTKFICNVSIPGTPYVLAKEVLHPGNAEQALTNETNMINVTESELALEVVSTTPRGDSVVIQTSTAIIILFITLLLLFK